MTRMTKAIRRWWEWGSRVGPSGQLERGSGTVLVLAVTFLVLTGLLLLGTLAQVVVARRSVAVAADLAALAAARHGVGPGPCQMGPRRAATVVAEANGADLTECQVLADASVRVQTSIPLAGVLARLPPVSATARAGWPSAGTQPAARARGRQRAPGP